MTLPLLELPDDPQRWPSWLERQLVGDELAELVDQLSLVLGDATQTTTVPQLDEICGPQGSAVLDRGLSVFSAEQIRLLLKHPLRLLELQERVLEAGQPYWTALLDTSAARTQTEAQWQELAPRLTDQLPAADVVVAAPKSKFRWRASLIGSLAAAVLIGVGLWWSQPEAQTGWNRPEVFTAQLVPQEYLGQLASVAEGELVEPMTSSATVERRLVSLRRGCDALLAAPHTQLADVDRDWLKERCRAWAKTFDEQLAALREGSRPWEVIGKETDATVRKLATALRNRQVS